MTLIHDLLAAGQTVSFEFFPPRTPEGERQLAETVTELATWGPSFVSVTYGAGGSTRALTRDLVIGLGEQVGCPVMPHLTCIGHSRPEVHELLGEYTRADVLNVLALAGDPPLDGSPAEGDFHYASELVEFARAQGCGSIGVAAFPEGHPRSDDLTADRRRLAEKLELADFAITQFFFDADLYARLVDDLASLGCTKPVIPGVIPMLNPSAVRRFADLNRVAFPEDLAERVMTATPDDAVRIAEEALTVLCDRLIALGTPGIHLYCMNRTAAVLDVAAHVRGRPG